MSIETVEHIELETFEPNSSDNQRYTFLIENCIQDEMINEMPYELVMKIKFRIDRDYLLEKYADLTEDCLSQVNKSYRWSIEKSILDYVLRSDREQSRLNVKLNKVTLKGFKS